MNALFGVGRSAVDYIANTVLPNPPDVAQPSTSDDQPAEEQLLPGISRQSGAIHDPETLIESNPNAPDLASGTVEHPAWQGDDLPRKWFSWRKLLAFTGPGLIMSIAYIDPGNLESDLQAGAKTGYTILWVLLWSTIMGYILQMLSVKIGVATGQHLAELCRQEYPPVSRYTLWLMAEIAIIGSDIQEVIGSAIAISLLSFGRIPLWAGVIITAVDAFLFLFLERFGVRRLEALFAIMIGMMTVAFGYMFIDVKPSLEHMLERLVVPRLPQEYVTTAVGIVGAIIMPHALYASSSFVLSRDLKGRHNSRKREAMHYFSIETGVALIISLFINVSVVTVFAKGFHNKGIKEEIGLANAGEYIGDTWGTAMAIIWAIGLLAAGQSATMSGTYTGQFIMGGYLNLKVSPWMRIMLTRSVALAPTLLVALLTQRPNQLDVLNQWLNILQSIQLPFAIIPVIMITSSERIMGPLFVNSRFTRTVAWAVALLVIGVNGYLVWVATAEHVRGSARLTALVITGVAAYLGFLIWIIVGPETMLKRRRARAGGAEAKTPLLDGTNGGSSS